jgi:hypothetical protein
MAQDTRERSKRTVTCVNLVEAETEQLLTKHTVTVRHHQFERVLCRLTSKTRDTVVD